MGYGSQKFATGAEFDAWVEKTDKWIGGISEDDITVLTCNFTGNETVDLTECEGIEGVDWGDGAINNNLTHTYVTGGTYNIKIFGVTRFKLEESNLDKNWLVGARLSNSVTDIKPKAFRYCRCLASVDIPNSVAWIGDEAFSGCNSLTSINIPNSVTNIGDLTFCCCNFTSINIPNSVIIIGSFAFSNCPSLTSVDIPNSVTAICYNAFENCPSMKSINIPASVASMDDFSLRVGARGCKIKINSTKFYVDYDNAFGSGSDEKFEYEVLVPYESFSDYKNDDTWKSLEEDKFIKLVKAVFGGSGTLTVAAEDWSSNAFSIAFADLGENDAVFFTPSTMEDKALVEDADVFISTEGDTVTFACGSMPNTAINFKYFICRGI